MARDGYTIPITAGEAWDRASIYTDEGGWYYTLRRADPHGEEFDEEAVGPFTSADEAERQARAGFIPSEDEAVD
ncbi:MAG: hypothetical protein ACYC4L_06430 [Chloroflexota bacterium]